MLERGSVTIFYNKVLFCRDGDIACPDLQNYDEIQLLIASKAGNGVTNL